MYVITLCFLKIFKEKIGQEERFKMKEMVSKIASYHLRILLIQPPTHHTRVHAHSLAA